MKLLLSKRSKDRKTQGGIRSAAFTVIHSCQRSSKGRIPSIWVLIGILMLLATQSAPESIQAATLSPKQREQAHTELRSTKEIEKRVRLFLLLIGDAQSEEAQTEELALRSDLNAALKNPANFEKVKVANQHEIGRLHFERGDLVKARASFQELLEILPVGDIKTRNLTLQYLSQISASLNDPKSEESYLAKYVIATGKTSAFYATSGGFKKLLELTAKNSSQNQHYYYENWYDAARQNGSPEEQKQVLTQWVNYTTADRAHFSDKPFEAYAEFLQNGNQLAELHELQLLHAQSSSDEEKKAGIYQQIHQQNLAESKTSDLGLLTFLSDYYQRHNQERQEQEILEILVKRSDYQHRISALKRLATISLKQEDWLLSFITHQELFKQSSEIRTPEERVILDNLISLSQRLSKDGALIEYLTRKALSNSPVISDRERQQAYNLLLDNHDLNQRYREALNFYTVFIKSGIKDPNYPQLYEIHFSAAIIAEKAGNFSQAIELYTRALDQAIQTAGYRAEFLKIAQLILQLTEVHKPGSAEFVILNKMRTSYQQLSDWEGVAKTDLIMAQKHQKNKDVKKALESYQQALESYRKTDNQARISEILTLLTNLEESDSGDKLARLTDLEASLTKTANTEALIKARIEIGNYYKLHDALEDAQSYYLKAFNTPTGAKTYLALEAGYFAALILTQLNRMEPANQLLDQIVRQAVATDQIALKAKSYQALAKNNNATGNYETGLKQIDQALALKVDDLKVSLLLTKTALLIGNQDYSTALVVSKQLQSLPLANSEWQTVYLYTAKAHVGLRRYDAALQEVNRGIGLQTANRYSETVYEMRSLKSLILSSLGDLNNALANQNQLIALLESENVKDKFGPAYLQLTDLYLQAGQLKNALESNQVASGQVSEQRSLTVQVLLNFAKIARLQNKLQQSIQYFEKIEQQLNDSVPKALQADILYQAGFTYLQFARFDAALKSFTGSENLFLELNQQKEARQAKLAQANVMMKQGTIQPAEAIYQAILADSADDPSLQADIYGNLAFLFTELGQYQKALDHSDKAEKLYLATMQTSRIPEILNARGLIYLRMNDFGQSEILFLKALEQNQDKNNPLLDSEITNNLGGLYKTKGELQKARTQLLKSAELQKSLGFESLLALTFNNIGSVYLEEGKFDEALEFLRQSRAFANQFDLKKELAVSWNNEGILFFKQNKFKEAESAFKKALEPQRELNLKVDIARTLNNLSIIAANSRNIKQALDLVQEAVAELSLQELDQSQFYPNPPQNSILASLLMKDFLQNKGAFLKEMAQTNNQPDQIVKYLEAAYQSFELSINLIESLRAQIKSEESQQLLLQTNIDIYQQMISILFDLGNRTKNPDFHGKAFFYAEKSRARSFLDQLQEQAARASLTLPQSIQDRENELKSQLSLLDKNIFVELSKPKNERDEKKIEQWQIAKTEQQILYAQLTKELEAKYPAYASIRYPTVYGVSEVKSKLLDAQSQVVMYFLGKDVSYGWRLSANRFEMIALPPAADIEQLIQKYRKTLVDPLVFYQEEEELVIDATNTHLVTGLQIYRTFLEPLIGNTPESITNLLIIPDGMLYYLPFETVLVQMHSQTDKNFAKGREYLLNRFAVYYSPSTSVLGMIQEQARQRDPALLAKRSEFVGFGDPQYQPAEKEKDSFPYNPTLKGLGFYSMPRLLATENELKRISTMFPKTATIYLGDAALESTAKNRSLGFRYVHFATHGIMDESNPEYSGVVLNLVKKDLPQDGFLQASEIFDLKLDSDLVVLSACETGLGKVIKGEGMVGLTRAFLYAGSPSIVVSLWTVADESTSKLMIYFYQYLKEGYSKGESLRQAKLSLMKEQNRGDLAYVDPFFWGPFVLNGVGF